LTVKQFEHPMASRTTVRRPNDAADYVPAETFVAQSSGGRRYDAFRPLANL
jgi:hypothetical protein